MLSSMDGWNILRTKNIQKFKIEPTKEVTKNSEETKIVTPEPLDKLVCLECIDKDNCGGATSFTKECLQFNYGVDEDDPEPTTESVIPDDIFFKKHLDPKILPLRTPLPIWRLCQYGQDLEVITDMAASMPTGVSIKSFKVNGKKFYALYTLEYVDPRKPRKKKKGEQVSSHWF
jgi:hypothetical protein